MTGDVLSAEDREALAEVTSTITDGLWTEEHDPLLFRIIERIVARHRAVAADAARAELVARVLALADEWDRTPRPNASGDEVRAAVWAVATGSAIRLRALVAPDHAETDREQG